MKILSVGWHLQISHICCNFVSVGVDILLKWCPIAMYTYLQQALPRVLIHRTQVRSREEMKVAGTVQPYQGEPRAPNGDEDKRWLGQDQDKWIHVTECLVCWVCVLFSMAKSTLRMVSYVLFCCSNILFLSTMCGEISSRSVLYSFVAVEKFCKGRGNRKELLTSVL